MRPFTRAKEMSDDRPLATGAVLGVIALSVVLGAPMVAYLWETLNELMAWQVTGRRLLISIPVLVLFALLLSWYSRTVQRLDSARQRELHPPRPRTP